MITCPHKITLTPAAERERVYEREHRIAESLQSILLRSPSGETLPGVCVEAFHEAVMDEATVGGDSFDAFMLDDDRAAIVIVDASGKGLAAAERVAEIRFALRAFLREHRHPSLALSCLNEFVCDAQRLGRRDDSTFATLTLVVLSGTSGEATCLCAGGEPPLLLRADGAVETAQICGPALGLFPGQGYASATILLGVGDTILLATDGLTEARHAGAFLGLEGVALLAAQAPGGSLSQIGQSVFEGVRAFAGGAFHDDACLLLARRQVQ